MTFCYIEIEKLRLGHGATGAGWGSAIWVVDITLRDPISHRGMVSHYAVCYVSAYWGRAGSSGYEPARPAPCLHSQPAIVVWIQQCGIVTM